MSNKRYYSVERAFHLAREICLKSIEILCGSIKLPADMEVDYQGNVSREMEGYFIIYQLGGRVFAEAYPLEITDKGATYCFAPTREFREVLITGIVPPSVFVRSESAGNLKWHKQIMRNRSGRHPKQEHTRKRDIYIPNKERRNYLDDIAF